MACCNCPEGHNKSVILSDSEFADGQSKTSPDSLVFPRPLWERARVRGVSKNNNKLLVIDWIVSHTLTMTKNFANNAILRELNNCSPQKDGKNSCRLMRGEVGKPKCKAAFTLVEGATHVVHRKNSRKIAFTLAEVLITLGIIGVVAAMTLPTLIEKHREQVTVNKVKKFYSNINQAYMMAKEDNDSISNWVDTSNGYDNIAAGKKVIETIIPYMKILKYCGNGKGCGVNNATYLLNGEYWNNYSVGRGYYKLILADGSVMWLRTSFTTTDYCKNNDGGYKNVCGVIWYDVNGEQSPNTIGKDIFSFIMLENGIMPNKDNCVVDKGGWGCTSYILQNGNMDYLHKK